MSRSSPFRPANGQSCAAAALVSPGGAWGVLLAVPALLALGGCGTPLVDTAERGEAELVLIEEALVEAVAWARNNPDTEWTSGWTGNAVVHATDDSTLGLCFEWQRLVWDVARPVAERAGWAVDGITINVDTWSAHYAVIVWDPNRVGRDELLTLPASAPAFVLDAWRNGEPEIYTVADWIDIPILVMQPPELEDLHTEYGHEPLYGPAGAARQPAPQSP